MRDALLTKNAEIDRNLVEFIQILPSLLAQHEGEYVLMRNTAVVGFFPSAIDAQIAGNNQFQDHVFSIQLVQGTAEELGYFSYAVPARSS